MSPSNIANQNVITLALFVSFIWAFIPILQKIILKNMSWRALILSNSVAQFIILCIMSLFFYKDIITDFKNIKSYNVLFLILLLSILNFTAITVYYNILSTKNTYDVVIITSIYFIGTILLNKLIFNESMTYNQIIATLLIILAVLIIST